MISHVSARFGDDFRSLLPARQARTRAITRYSRYLMRSIECLIDAPRGAGHFHRRHLGDYWFDALLMAVSFAVAERERFSATAIDAAA